MTAPVRHPEPDRGFGRDGISGLVSTARAMRARDVSRPTATELAAAELTADAIVAALARRSTS
ncbi:MAG TPA: hypothetical protein PKV13_09040 [Propionicimonas sp.]|nr:hypothetical protein [Propionicimonas sp.]HRA06750.1 hypothetical protein [Propionicimonas sp.]